MPAEIRHEGGETLRTSFSRDLAKWVDIIITTDITIAIMIITTILKRFGKEGWYHQTVSK